MARYPITGSSGLFTASAIGAPPNSLKQATHVVVRRGGLISKRRPLREYTNNTPTYAVLFGFSGRIYSISASGNVRADDGTGTFNSVGAAPGYPGAPGNPAPSGSQLSYAYIPIGAVLPEMFGNGYIRFLNAVAPCKIDTASTVPYQAGVPRALDLQLTAANLGSGSVMTATGHVTAYRVTYGLKDANKLLVIGPPSNRATLTSTNSCNVTVRSDIPVDISGSPKATSYFYQVWRTAENTTGADPGDECKLVYQAQLTSTDVSNTYIQVTDTNSDAVLQDSLYTNPSQEKIAAANYQPPMCGDMNVFRGAMFYANTLQKHRSRLVMLGIPEEMAIQSIAANTPGAGQSTYTFAAPVDTTGLTTAMYLSVTGSTGASNDGSWQIVSSTSTTVIVTNAGVNQVAAGGTAITGKVTVGSTDLFPVYTTESVGNKQYNVPTTGTVSQRLASTAQSFCRMVNRQRGAVYAYYESGPDDGPGRIMFEGSSFGGASFNVTSVSTTTSGYANALPNRFAPTIPTTTPLVSTNDAAINRLYYSKYQQPEHVPLAQYFDIGSKLKAILRIVPLRDAMLIFKEDGLFRLTGDGTNWAIAQVDPTLVLLPRGTYGGSPVDTVHNVAYAATNKGAVAATENGARLISKQIQDRWQPFSDSPAASYCQTIGAERDGLIYFSLTGTGMDGTGNDLNTTLVYNKDTDTWTVASGSFPTYRISITTCPIALPGFYFSDAIWRIGALGGVTPQVWTESEISSSENGSLGYSTSNETLSADRWICTVTGSSGSAAGGTVTITIQSPGLHLPTTATLYIQENSPSGSSAALYKVTAVSGSGPYTLTVASVLGTGTFGFTNAKAALYTGIQATVEWNPINVGSDADNKRFTEVSVLLDPQSTCTNLTVGTYTDVDTTVVQQPTSIQGTQTVITNARTLIPLTQQQARRLSVQAIHSTPAESMFISGLRVQYDEMPDGHELG